MPWQEMLKNNNGYHHSLGNEIEQDGDKCFQEYGHPQKLKSDLI
ncbi:13480_t:CDS:2 [Entrophospora sp. SA101]|nr:6752_t:CDS:2 [Entrophospora sp. SA101]CAJ0647141.1 13480_t:CDS:2 [Entrophospora sp. SA101]